VIAEALTLFDELPPPPASPAADRPLWLTRCLWHGLNEPKPETTHRVVKAVNLMHPRWWRNGLRDDGGLRACDGGRVRLYLIGAGFCDACVAACNENPDSDDERFGTLTHFIPYQPRGPLPQEKEELR
jgi:hypothetical protein